MILTKVNINRRLILPVKFDTTNFLIKNIHDKFPNITIHKISMPTERYDLDNMSVNVEVGSIMRKHFESIIQDISSVIEERDGDVYMFVYASWIDLRTMLCWTRFCIRTQNDFYNNMEN